MIKRFIIAFILLVIVAGGLVGFNIYRSRAIQEHFANAPAQTMTVSATKVEPTTWHPELQAIGTVAAIKGVDLTVETTGIVREVNFKANQHVEKGQVLVQLDDAVQNADLEAAKTQAALDIQARDRAIKLEKRGVGSTVSVEQADATASASKSQVAKLRAVLDQKQIRAPFSGTIGLPRIDVGQYLSPGTTVATLQDLDTMRADFTLPEQKLGDLKMDQSIRLGLTDGKLDFKGAITGIDPKVDPATRLVSVRAEIDNHDHKLSPGQFVQVRIELPTEKNVLAVPQTALVTSLYGDFVYVVRPADQAKQEQSEPKSEPKVSRADSAMAAEKPRDAAKSESKDQPKLIVKQAFVQDGRRNRGMIEILKGIKEGDQIVTAGQNRLSGGQAVTVDNSVDPTQVAQEETSTKEGTGAQ